MDGMAADIETENNSWKNREVFFDNDNFFHVFTDVRAFYKERVFSTVQDINTTRTKTIIDISISFSFLSVRVFTDVRAFYKKRMFSIVQDMDAAHPDVVRWSDQ